MLDLDAAAECYRLVVLQVGGTADAAMDWCCNRGSCSSRSWAASRGATVGSQTDITEDTGRLRRESVIRYPRL
jgi:hypothetical protein